MISVWYASCSVCYIPSLTVTPLQEEPYDYWLHVGYWHAKDVLLCVHTGMEEGQYDSWLHAGHQHAPATLYPLVHSTSQLATRKTGPFVCKCKGAEEEEYVVLGYDVTFAKNRMS